ncbi:hypothetical protein BAUCODRAFT_31931 [Baudoinia panamericana UAMH 10762]|uniref:Amidohydrolase-related domain-containing protein n=1 Tax=Baudoinia panamericana (strain UAMH 10762) TaxID=717646 RepID=M2NG09_BAUPA|nr:uncharacterized protein BAUCODRAFT_31931 [Baudoinia panamericana UAMH 10762]EMC97925.1 hypothetical protein BAUCODRAFT_31931 [Baudoinia panamericana UAMH 10762]
MRSSSSCRCKQEDHSNPRRTGTVLVAFMLIASRHGIDKSVLSLANPWLDFLPSDTAAETARQINDDVERMCAEHEGKLYAFGTLPLSAPAREVVQEVERLASLPHHRGIVMGTSGLGTGVDDPALDPIYAALEKHEQVIFLHPHYGLPTSVYGERASDYGHVLPLALGFPMETTIAVARMLLSGVFDRFPKLSILIAHSGGTLPFLAGRIESCIAHDAHLKKLGRIESRRNVWDVLKNNVYLDAVIYADVGLKAAIDASGADRLMFGMCTPCAQTQCCSTTYIGRHGSPFLPSLKWKRGRMAKRQAELASC